MNYKYVYAQPSKLRALKHDDLGFSDTLCHAKKGEEVANHKYVSREFKDGRWVYVYKDEANDHDIKDNNKQVQVLNQISKIDAIQDESKDDIVNDKTYYDGTISLGEIMKNDEYNNYKNAEEYYENAVKELNRYKYFLDNGNDEWSKQVIGKEYSQKDYVQLMVNYTYAKKNLKDSYDKLKKSCEKRFGEIPDHAITSYTSEYYDYLQRKINGVLDTQDSNMVSVSTNKKK